MVSTKDKLETVNKLIHRKQGQINEPPQPEAVLRRVNVEGDVL